jgi:hypothetical protein
MQYCLVYEDINGYCKIVYPQGNFWDTATDIEKAIQHLHSMAIPHCVEFIACDPRVIPQDVTFRDAWKKGDKDEPIRFDFQKALAIHRKRIQEAANKKIEALQKELEIALEDDNLPKAVAIRRTNKILRTFEDINLTHCKTIEDIKYSIPLELHDVWKLYNPKRPL